MFIIISLTRIDANSETLHTSDVWKPPTPWARIVCTSGIRGHSWHNYGGLHYRPANRQVAGHKPQNRPQSQGWQVVVSRCRGESLVMVKRRSGRGGGWSACHKPPNRPQLRGWQVVTLRCRDGPWGNEGEGLVINHRISTMVRLAGRSFAVLGRIMVMVERRVEGAHKPTNWL